MIPLSPICISACLRALPSLHIRDFLDWEQQGSLSAKSCRFSRDMRIGARFCLPNLSLVFQIHLPRCVNVTFVNFLFVILQSRPSLCFFHLTQASPSFTAPLLMLIFMSCLVSHTPHSIFPFCLFFLHLFAPSLSTPSSLLWSDHKANFIKPSFIRPLCIFPGVLSCMCVLVNKIYLSLTDLSDREFHLPELMFKQYPL